MGETVSSRLPDDVVSALDEIGAATGRTRSDVLRDVVKRGIAAEKLALAIEGYRTHSLSLGKATELSGLPMGVFLDELRRAGVLRHYGRAELDEDIAWARGK